MKDNRVLCIMNSYCFCGILQNKNNCVLLCLFSYFCILFCFHYFVSGTGGRGEVSLLSSGTESGDSFEAPGMSLVSSCVLEIVSYKIHFYIVSYRSSWLCSSSLALQQGSVVKI